MSQTTLEPALFRPAAGDQLAAKTKTKPVLPLWLMVIGGSYLFWWCLFYTLLHSSLSFVLHLG